MNEKGRHILEAHTMSTNNWFHLSFVSFEFAIVYLHV